MAIPYDEHRKLAQSSPYLYMHAIDLSVVKAGAPIHRWCNYGNETIPGGPQLWGGVNYYPLPIMMTGYAQATAGAPKQPQLSISNVSAELLSAVIEMGDCVGAYVYRWGVYAKHLDNGSNPDSTRFDGPEIFMINQMDSLSEQGIVFNICALYDRRITLPAIQALKYPTSMGKGFPGLNENTVGQ